MRNRQYNVLDAGEGRGDELYGVEPVSYYVKNLFLNTSIAFPLALALPLLALPLYPMADKVGFTRVGPLVARGREVRCAYLSFGR